jgi:hypothetical protein
MPKKYGADDAADKVASYLRRRGVDLDSRRLDETVAAARSRAKADFAAYRDQVEEAAFAAKKARRACELDEAAWRRSPTQDNLQRAKAAQQARKAAQEALREVCNFDEEMITSVKLRYGR